MKALVIDRNVVRDSFLRLPDGQSIPDRGAVLVSLATWRAHEASLRRRGEPTGVILTGGEHPGTIANAVGYLRLVALEFPSFRDGRAYSYARLLRERYGFSGELRAVGDVLLEQLHYMERVGINAFELDSDDPLMEFETAAQDFSVWYQPSGDRRIWAARIRNNQAGC